MSERIWLRRAWIGLVAGAMVATATAGVAAAAHHPSSKPPKVYYLALGDSLSVGWQPSSSNPTGSETTQGYTNDLDKFYKKVIKGLQYEDLGCPGETTSTMINGGCSGGTSYSEGDQLSQAEYFIEHNKVAFVTIDIGANDVDGCAGLAETTADPYQDDDITNCVVDGMTDSTLVNNGTQTACQYNVGGTWNSNTDTCTPGSPVEGVNGSNTSLAGMNSDIATIMSGLESAGAEAVTDSIDTTAPPVYAMNLYNPFLAVYLLNEKTFALWTVEGPCSSPCTGSSLDSYFQGQLTNDFNSNGVAAVADVADAFGTYDTGTGYNYTPPVANLDTSTSDPHDVHDICALTWECTDYANIHANKTGYAQIATAFEAVMSQLP